jgi:hypothetical protein
MVHTSKVLSLAMLVHIVESCPAVHSRFVPKPKIDTLACSSEDNILTLEEIITDDASVLPFGITCINITDMLAKFLLFSKAVDKMDALLSAKPFWKMFIDPNSMLILQEISLDLLCDVCVEIGRERRVQRLVDMEKGKMAADSKDGQHRMPGTQNGKVRREIWEWTLICSAISRANIRLTPILFYLHILLLSILKLPRLLYLTFPKSWNGPKNA